MIDLAKELQLEILSFCSVSEVTKYRSLHSYFKKLIDQNENYFYSITEAFVKNAYRNCLLPKTEYEISYNLEKKLTEIVLENLEELYIKKSKFINLFINLFPTWPACQKELNIQKSLERRLKQLNVQYQEVRTNTQKLNYTYMQALSVMADVVIFEFKNLDDLSVEDHMIAEKSHNKDIKNISEVLKSELIIHFGPQFRLCSN